MDHTTTVESGLMGAVRNLGGGNRIAFVLVAIGLLNVAYPFSERSMAAALVFVGIYLVLTGSSIYLVSKDRRLLILSIALALIIAVCGSITIASDFTAPVWIQAAWNSALLAQIAMMIALLILYIVGAKTVHREVLFAAIAIYFLLAGLFSVIYVVIETFAPGAFLSSSGAEITWQRLTYFSLVTISTLGYGDIVPVAPAAQSLSAMQASLGTLYVAVLIGRFVSLYQQRK